MITEFKLAKVNTIEQANIFLKSYLKKYNKKFSIEPKSNKSYFVQVPSYLNLDLLLSIKLTRCIDASGSFTIKNKKFQILDNKIMPKTKVNIYMSQKIGIIAEHNNTKYKVICSDNLPNTYKNKTADKFFKEHSQELFTFALSLLTYDAKEKDPVLTSS